MPRSIVLAWGVAVGIITYRTVKTQHRPPMPGTLLASSGLFIVLGLLSGPAPELAGALGWGFDFAALLNLGNIGGPSKTTPPTAAGAGGGQTPKAA